MPNSLTAQAGLKLGPIVLETFFKHYLERKSETQDEDGLERSTNLRHDELLWQESFEIVKRFLNQATKHTVEELQEFSNARIPAPPWIWIGKILVPMSSCDLAATHLIKALGGDEVTKRVVGGTKWWQVRGLHGVDCQWICQKSQMHDAQKRKRENSDLSNGNSPVRSPSSPRFPLMRGFSNNWAKSPPTAPDDTPKSPKEERNDPETVNDREVDITDMDGTRCMLYAHGVQKYFVSGGYYFGSIDQERYCMQRYARKINGRVFACNYRLSPQYPFPCAIQDLIAAYLYLIDPPLDAPHAPVKPELIVLAGDSAGGGLCLAALQVMRDSGIPLPAGAVLISPWSDLTHSFPSIAQNTATDIIPTYGLCFHKPSVLWPPPSDEISSRVRAGLKARFQKVGKRAAMVEAFLQSGMHTSSSQVNDEVREITQKSLAGVDSNTPHSKAVPDNGSCLKHDKDICRQNTTQVSAPEDTEPQNSSEAPDVFSIAGRLPLPWEPSDSVHLEVDGNPVTINTQIQLYCPNSLVVHPLVSPVLGYLGGLPPLLVIASDKEVLRDEVIYLAHKAAYPDRFPVNGDSKKIYPTLQGIEDRYGPTSVHLQIYDETAHVLPLFSFTTPAKYCYRAIATFVKHLTPSPRATESTIVLALQNDTPRSEKSLSDTSPLPPTPNPSDSPPISDTSFALGRVSSVLRSHSSLLTRRGLKGLQNKNTPDEAHNNTVDSSRENSGDVAGNRFKENADQPRGPGTAGDPSAYALFKTSRELPLGNTMIRERVSTQGALRPLERESELAALQLQPDHIGKVNEAAAQRYLTGLDKWSKKFAKTAAKIEAQRLKNLELAQGETSQTVKTMAQFQEHLFREHVELDSSAGPSNKSRTTTFSRPRKVSPVEHHNWVWAWALDGEHPPPTSIVSRRDTVEARNLARVADLSVEQEESKMSGNMLWAVLVNFLTANPRQERKAANDMGVVGEAVKGQGESEDKSETTRTRIFRRIKSFGGSGNKRLNKRDLSPPAAP